MIATKVPSLHSIFAMDLIQSASCDVPTTCYITPEIYVWKRVIETQSNKPGWLECTEFDFNKIR